MCAYVASEALGINLKVVDPTDVTSRNGKTRRRSRTGAQAGMGQTSTTSASPGTFHLTVTRVIGAYPVHTARTDFFVKKP